MIQFLCKVLALARPYRTRLVLGVMTGVAGGLMEPLMIATVVLVYSLIFPTAVNTTSTLVPKDLKAPAALAARLQDPSNPVAAFLLSHFSPEQRGVLANPASDSDRLVSVLVENLNHQLQCEVLYEAARFSGVNLGRETRLVLAENPEGERLILLNRLLLDDAFPADLKRVSAFPLASQLKWAPEWVHDWAVSAQLALSGGVRTHRVAALAIIGLIPLVLLFRGLFSYLNIYLLQWVAVRAITDLRVRLFSHLMGLSAGFFSQMRTGELISRTNSDTSTLQGIISNSVPVMVKDPVTLASLAAWLLWQQPQITLISMVVMPVCMAPVLIYNRKVRRSARELQAQNAELSSIMVESFSGARVVKAYNLEETLIGQFKTVAKRYVGHYMRIVRSMEIPGPLMEFVGSIGVSLVLVFLMTHAGQRPGASDFLAVVLSIFAMYRPLKNLARLYNTLEQARAASARVFDLLATHNDISEPAQPKPLHASGAPIQFEGIEFSYGDKTVLRDITLTVAPGTLVALVGSSGSGKTTLTNLLLRFYDPQKGTIRIGGTDIREVATKDLRNQIAVVTQDTVLFNVTIRRNIELGRPGVTFEQVVQAAKHAYAYDFVMNKPSGFDTPAGEKGAHLSGGQKQRLAIARAIVRDAPILILDEATNALDTESEAIVQAALEDLMKNRTTICIAHRLSTIQKADLIVVLDQGRIVETGTHAQLIERRGLYSKLHEIQFRSPGSQ